MIHQDTRQAIEKVVSKAIDLQRAIHSLKHAEIALSEAREDLNTQILKRHTIADLSQSDPPHIP